MFRRRLIEMTLIGQTLINRAASHLGRDVRSFLGQVLAVQESVGRDSDDRDKGRDRGPLGRRPSK